MRSRKLFGVCATSLLLAGFSSPALAGDRGLGTLHFFADSLGVSVTATDVYSLQCPEGTFTARADVNDNGGVDGVLLSVQVINPLGRAISRTAPDNGISAQASLSGGPGNYLVTFHKSGGGALEAYDSIVNCHNGVGAIVNPHSVIRVQNQ